MKLLTPVAALLCVLALSFCSATDSTHYLDIPAGKLTTAIELLARQSRVEFIYSPEELEGLQTRGVHGNLSTREALARLLEGSGLVVTVHPSGAFLIRRPGASPKTPRGSVEAPPAPKSSGADTSVNTPQNGGVAFAQDLE